MLTGNEIREKFSEKNKIIAHEILKEIEKLVEDGFKEVI